MAQAMKPIRGRELEETDFQSNNLWVGSLATGTTESDLAELFGKYGDIDRITAYSSRSFAFVYFRRVEDAVAAKEALQGTALNGSRIKIEFSRPAKPCKSLWVGGISPSVTKEHLQAEFSKFGKIEDFRFLRERNTAFVDYFELDDAVQALKSMNGRRMGGGQLRVDFLRSHASKKEPLPSSYDARGLGPADGNLSAKRSLAPSGDRKGDGQPSNILWIGYPPSVQIDEQMLHNAMILFGEIEKIKSYPLKHYSFVEFRSVEEARCAKEGLQGRLFNDPRITIMYSNSELAPGKEDTGYYSGTKRSRPDTFLNDVPFRSSPMDSYGRGNSMPSSNGILGSMRPFQGSLDPIHNNGPEYNDLAGKEANWRRPSPPGQGILPSPAQGMRLAMRQNPSSWDPYDPSQVDREFKRTRRDGSVDGFPLESMDDRFDRSYGRAGRSFPGSDYIWRGIIAKGGTPVCHARCVPIGNGIEAELPEVINCSARTGLDMLAKHYAEAIGFDIVFFLPDSEDDFASYTEFLHYLGSKDRAGVAKFDDGTTLFLVPPSDFLTNVLEVSGPERLYGVVLKLPPPPPAAPVAASYRQESLSLPSSYMDQARASPANPNHGLYAASEERASSLEYNMGLREDFKFPSKQMFTPTSEPVGGHSVPKEQTRAGVSLTPELIATLTSLLPAASQSAAPEAHQPHSGTSTIVSSLQQSAAPVQAWNQGYQPTTSEHVGHLYQQFGNQYDPQGQLPPPPLPQNYPPISNTPGYSGSMVHGGIQFHEQTVSMPQQHLLPPRPLNNYPMFSQGSHLTVSQPVTQKYQPEAGPMNQSYGTDPSGLHGYPPIQHANNPSLTSPQPYIANNPSLPQNILPLAADKGNVELPTHGQQLQSVLPGAGQGSSEGGEVDKNQRYQSTLQFAANLLLQIQQQQQSNNPAGQGTGS